MTVVQIFFRCTPIVHLDLKARSIHETGCVVPLVQPKLRMLTLKLIRFIPHHRSRFNLVGWLVFLFILCFSCRKDEFQLPDPVFDGVVRSDFPRLALTTEKQAEMKSKTATPQWVDLTNRMANVIQTGNDQYGFGAFHYATAFAVTNDQKFADKAKQIIFRIIDEPGYCDVTSTYLRAPGCTGQVALAADVLFDQLTDAEKNKIFDYLEVNAKGIIDLQGWSGWGWQDGNPEFKQLNNFYPGHVQTILHYALLAYNYRELARQYYARMVTEELPAAFELMRQELKGGHGAEGTWYDDKMMGHYAEVVLMLRKATNGAVDFGEQYPDVFADYVKSRLYGFQPIVQEGGKPQLYQLPTGDQPAVAGAKVIDLARLHLWLFFDVLKSTSESEAAGFIRYFEENVQFESKGWQREYQLQYLLHYDNTAPAIDYTQNLALSYFSEGKGVAYYRTGWGPDAMTVTIHFSPGQGQRASHWHFGEGAFYIWNNGWQADHLNRVEGNGVRQNTGLMNTLLINGSENSQGHGDARVLYFVMISSWP